MTPRYMDFIGLYAGAVDHALCADLIRAFEECNALGVTHAGVTKRGLDASIKNSRDLDLRAFPHLLGLQNAVVGAVDSCYQAYQDEYPQVRNALASHKITSLQVQKYDAHAPTAYFPFHCEAGSSDTANRVAAYIVYLNDVDLGGETEFLHQKLRVSPKCGSVCIFPAYYTHTHRGNPVLSSEAKYILTGWYTYI